MKSIYEYQIDHALNDKRGALYWVAHYEAMSRLTDGQCATLNAYRRKVDVCEQEYRRVKSRLTRATHAERKAVTR